MTREEKLAFKHSLKQFCQTIIEQRIQTGKALIDSAQQAANNEEKSSAGDKYETARAMGHLDKDMHTGQLMQNIKELAYLQQVNVTQVYTGVTSGVYIKCSTISFFIAAGIGRQVYKGQAIVFLSPGAPLAKLIMGKQAGDNFVFGNAKMMIEDIW